MSLFIHKNVPKEWSNVETFTFGQSSIYGYDCSNYCILISSTIDGDGDQNLSIHRCHLSASPTWPIQKLIVNPDETIIALVAQKLVYLVQLSSINDPNSKTSNLCPIIRVTYSSPSTTKQTNNVIDFLWLTSKHFLIVNSIPSASECHLYSIRSFKEDSLDLIRTYSVGLISNRKSGTPNKKISLHQPSDIVHLSLMKRKESDETLFRILAIKTDGEIYILHLNENKLQSNEKIFDEEFEGPLRYVPTSFDNYGCDHSHSLTLSLETRQQSIMMLTRNRYQLDQCLILSKHSNEHYLFTIDSIQFGENRRITQMIADPFTLNRSYLLDHQGNVYLIEYPWIEHIENLSTKTFPLTNIQTLIVNSDPTRTILHIGIVRRNQSQTSLVVILQWENDQKQKELFYLPNPIVNDQMTSSVFLTRIHSILLRKESIPRLILSSKTSEMISEDDFQKNLSKFIRIFADEYLERQNQAMEEIRSRQNCLSNLRETQLNKFDQLKKKSFQVNENYRKILQEYQQEIKRRNRLKSNFDDLLSMIEQNLPILSEKEIQMKLFLKKSEIQLKFFNENLLRLEQYLSMDDQTNENANDSLQYLQDHLVRYQQQIQQLRTQFEHFQQNK